MTESTAGGVPSKFVLEDVPEAAEVPAVARRVREACGLGPTDPVDLDAVCRVLGVDLCERALGARGGGLQALLRPQSGNRFKVDVDPEPRCGWEMVDKAARESLHRHRRRFLICHELGHTLFYAAGSDRPNRVVPDSRDQEAFCDEFALHLLVPTAAGRALAFSPESVIALQDRFEVSMELALRGAAAAHCRRQAWLLLTGGPDIRVQWTSARPAATGRLLKTLTKMVGDCLRLGRPVEAEADGAGLRASFLEGRGQAIVTETS